VLSPAFVEHLMGLPPGWVTDLPLPPTAQLRALGNGVVPQQAAYAVSLLLADFAALIAAERGDLGRKLNAA
jgi:DNA (cytosine-5)-methyltransferase 1